MGGRRGWRLSAALLALTASWAVAAATQADQETFVPAPLTMRNNISFHAANQTIATYRFGDELAKPIIWPLLAPKGDEVTRAWPMRPAAKGGSTDHKHQKSAWFTYGDVVPEGMKLKHKRKGVQGIDFWAEEPGCGRIVCVRTRDFHHDDNRASVTTENEWRTADGDKIMDEVRKIRFLNYETARLIVVDIDLLASVVPIVFGDTKEGAFGVRVADSMTEKMGKGRLTNAEGKVGMLQCWGRVSAWCDYSGPVEGKTVGIAIFASPDNPLPSAWHSRDYGLMAANPFARAKSGYPDMTGKKDLVRLAKDEHLKLRYGIYVHAGDVKEGKVAEGYELFKKMK
jgi:hypothetical protein